MSNPPSPFNPAVYATLARVSGLELSFNGTRLVTTVATPGADGKEFTSSLWELDPDGERAPVRLTRSAPGESDAAFLPDGSLLFTSARPDPERKPDKDAEEMAGLWLLPAGGGEARLLAAPPGGVGAVAVARDTGAVVLAAAIHRGAEGWVDDAERHTARKDAGVKAQLFEAFPIRLWDRWLGPRERHLFAAPAPQPAAESRLDPTDLTPEPGQSLEEQGFDLTPDGRTVVTCWWREAPDPRDRTWDVVAIDVASGDRRELVHADRTWFWSPACSPDGSSIVVVRQAGFEPDRVGDQTLWLIDLATGEGRDLLPGFDRWPNSPAWLPDASGIVFVADDGGHTLPFVVDLSGGAVSRLAADGAYSDLRVSPDGSQVYALRSALASAPRAVVLDLTASDQNPRYLPTPGDDLEPPGRVERVEATADDGVAIGSWLVLPASDGQPAPLVVFIHGGPLGSWSGWHWRWNPHMLAARGYAVLLPDPALSTGYGTDFIARGWGRWGAEPYTDLMAAVEAAAGRDDIDDERIAAMGGSFGGYMANWVAGHSERFKAIVTHASLWALRGFHGTTDLGPAWEDEFGDPYVDPERYDRNSPHHHVARIATPMLVIHGEQDFRVPVSEALTLWTDLKRHGVDAKFLYFPDENHWVRKPPNITVWYETVLAFLDHHVLGKDWVRPSLL